MISLPDSSEKSVSDVIHDLTNLGFEVWDTCLGDEGVTLQISQTSPPLRQQGESSFILVQNKRKLYKDEHFISKLMHLCRQKYFLQSAHYS